MPKHAGSSVVYSREFFELARRRLTGDGVMVQWLGSPAEPREFQWTAATFGAVFPNATFWLNGDVGVGSTGTQPVVDAARLGVLMREPARARELASVGLRTVADVEAMAARVPDAVGRKTIITDDRPALEYFLTLPLLAWITQR